MTAVPRPLAALFLLALGGLVVAVGIVLADVGGVPVLAVYLVLVLALLAAGAVRVRRAAASRARPAAHCTCCDGDHSAPVRVV